MEKVNYHRQVMDILDKCEEDIITLVNENGGEIEVPYDDDANLDLELPCYDSNGDTYYTTITKVKVRKKLSSKAKKVIILGCFCAALLLTGVVNIYLNNNIAPEANANIQSSANFFTNYR